MQVSGVSEDREMSRFAPAEELFAGRHFDAKIVVLCVRIGNESSPIRKLARE